MKIVIVDDNAEFAQKIERIVRDFFEKTQEKLDVKIYNNGYTLLNDLEENKNYDIYFFDVEMPMIDGLTLAQKVKAVEEDAYIVFVTSHEKYAIPSYKIRANYYILQEEYKEELVKVLERIWGEIQLERMRQDTQYYVIQNEVRSHRIRYDDILYLTKEKKYTVMHCRKDDYKERNSLDNVFQKLPGESFIYIDRGCIVNLRYVVEMTPGEITLFDGVRYVPLTVSRRMNTEVKERLAKYWRKA